MKKQKGVSIDEIRAFAAAWQNGAGTDTSERAKAILEDAAADGKKFAEKAGEAPEIVPFLLDHGMIPKDQLMEYYLKISWLEHRDIILQLKAFESRKRGESVQPAAVAVSGKTEAQIKAEWRTEKCEDGTLRLLSYKGEDEVIEVPEKIGKSAVTEIGPFAFSPLMPRLKSDQKPIRERIREIRLGNSIRALGESCFQACPALRQVTLPAGLKSIPKQCFADCKALAKIELPEGLTTIGCKAFANCAALEEIRLPDSVNQFQMDKVDWRPKTSAAFSNCKRLKTIRLPAGLKVIPKEMLSECSSLESISLPESLEEIGDDAFAFCSALKALELPAGLKRMGEHVIRCAGPTELRLPAALEKLGGVSFGFSSALADSNLRRLILPFGTVKRFRELRIDDIAISSLQEFVLDTEESELTVKEGALYTADMKTLLKVPPICGTTFTVHDGVESIEPHAFAQCTAHSIFLPNSVKSIGKACFIACTAECIVLSAALEDIPKYAFSACKKLEKIDLPAAIASLGENCFFECEALERITVPGSVKKIEDRAFCECKKLKEVVLEDGVEEIGYGAFKDCGKLEKAVIPASVTSLQDGIQRWETVFNRSDKLTIYAVPGSAAEKYAKQKWLKVSPMP